MILAENPKRGYFVMRTFLKYTLYTLLFTTPLLLYLLFTHHGNRQLYSFLGQQLSQKHGVTIKVHSIDFDDYPTLKIITEIEKKATLTLLGELTTQSIDMKYHLKSSCITLNACSIDDAINIKGEINGEFSKISIDGKGVALDGNVSYRAIKYANHFEDIAITMDEINSSKLFELLGQDALIKGKAHAQVNFDFMSENHRRGVIEYRVHDENFKNLSLDLSTHIHINDDLHTFTMDIVSSDLNFTITQGDYNQKKSQIHAHYLLDIPELERLETLLNYKYRGSLHARGEIFYKDRLKIIGNSKSFGGMSEFIFEENMLHVELQDVFLHEMLHLFPIPAMLTANATGVLSYDFNRQMLKADTNLTNAKFLHCKLVNIIYKKSGVNMLHEDFNNSVLTFGYHQQQITGDLRLTNEDSHLFLTNTIIHTSEETIDTYFDFKMQQQEFSGKVYGDIKSPKVNLNMQKLIRYQMDKQVDKLIGRTNRKIMESMPMSNVAKDLATDMGASFMKMFF
jgi:hypothetical protein